MMGLSEALASYEAVIGLEIHTALTALETKLFCGCTLSRGDAPNTHVCPVCLGLPGALPVPNAEAVRATVMVGLACGCAIMPRSMHWRKYYFYPDMAKNFQTTQGPVPLCADGAVVLEVAPEAAAERLDDGVAREKDGSYTVPIRIKRIHLEEDAAKMVHVGGTEGRIGGAAESLIDYNRCGTPLIELVTEADLRTPEEARLFMEKIREIFRALGISDCSMEAGSMRCDGNVSLRRRGADGLGEKCELKNLNSFKSLHDALAYEIRRQAELLERGDPVVCETRHFEPASKRTVVLRSKEAVDDYRFFPDPDLAPFDLSEEFVGECRARMPELPDAKRARYMDAWGLARKDAARLAGDPETAALFERAVACTGEGLALTVAKVAVNMAPGFDLSAEQLGCVARMLADDALSGMQARELIALVSGTDLDPEAVADERGMKQTSDAASLAHVVDAVLAACPEQRLQYRDGNVKVIGYLIGQCMRSSGGRGNPKLFKQLLAEALKRP